MRVTRNKNTDTSFCYITDIEDSLVSSYTELRQKEFYLFSKESNSKSFYLYYTYVII